MRVEPHEDFKGVYWLYEQTSKLLATKNMDRGYRIYGERLIEIGGEEYREWIPYRSKLAAAILCGLRELPITPSKRILYLGAATGTTVSHVSDIIERDGAIFAVDFAPRVMTQFMEKVARRRSNVVPIFADARVPEGYPPVIGEVDVIYCDVAQPEQAKIFVENCRLYLKRGGHGLVAIKSRSIDSVEDPETVYRKEIGTLERGGLTVAERIDIDRYERDHIMVRVIYG